MGFTVIEATKLFPLSVTTTTAFCVPTLGEMAVRLGPAIIGDEKARSRGTNSAKHQLATDLIRINHGLATRARRSIDPRKLLEIVTDDSSN
jgi:hypothetical protein